MSNEKQDVEKIGNELIAILARFVKLGKKTDLTTELYRDIGLAGDDVDDFVKEIESRFNIDMGAFETWQYFPDEGMMIMDWPLKLLGFKTRMDPSNYQSLSFHDLAKYIAHKQKGTLAKGDASEWKSGRKGDASL